MTQEVKVVLITTLILVVVYLFAHFTGLEALFNEGPREPTKPVVSTKINSHTSGHFTLLYYPSKSKTDILYIEDAWKKKAEYKYLGEISHDFPPNFSRRQVKSYIIAKAKRKGANVVVVNWLSTNHKLLVSNK